MNYSNPELKNQLLALKDPLVDEHLLSIANGSYTLVDGLARMAIDLAITRRQRETASIMDAVEARPAPVVKSVAKPQPPQHRTL